MKNIIEKLAAIEHQRWSDWQKYLHSKCLENTDGSLTIMNTDVLNWNRQIGTHYDFLSEKEKESDRKEVMRYLPVIEHEIKRVITLFKPKRRWNDDDGLHKIDDMKDDCICEILDNIINKLKL